MIYYKATALDGRSFMAAPSGHRARYTVGRTTSIPYRRRVKKPLICSSDVLHASETPSETLIGGGYFPCRLFEVSGEPVCSSNYHRKHGFVALRVEREIESWRALGPNGREVHTLLERVATLSAASVVDRPSGRDDVLDAAWSSTHECAIAHARSGAIYGAGRAAQAVLPSSSHGPYWAAAIYFATGAVVMRDLIPPESFALLYAPLEPHIPADSLGAWETLHHE
jgi:hypothetical protein